MKRDPTVSQTRRIARCVLWVLGALLALQFASWTTGYLSMRWSLRAAHDAFAASIVARPVPDPMPAERRPGAAAPASERAEDVYRTAAAWVDRERAAARKPAARELTRRLRESTARRRAQIEAEAPLRSLLHEAARRPVAVLRFQGIPPGAPWRRHYDTFQLSLRRAVLHYAEVDDPTMRAHCIATLLQMSRDLIDHGSATAFDAWVFEVLAHALTEDLAQRSLPLPEAVRLAEFALQIDQGWPPAGSVARERASRHARTLATGALGGFPTPWPRTASDAFEVKLADDLDALIATGRLLDAVQSLPWDEAERRLDGSRPERSPDGSQRRDLADLRAWHFERTWLRVLAVLLHLHAGLEPPELTNSFDDSIPIRTHPDGRAPRIDCGPGFSLPLDSRVVRSPRPR